MKTAADCLIDLTESARPTKKSILNRSQLHHDFVYGAARLMKMKTGLVPRNRAVYPAGRLFSFLFLQPPPGDVKEAPEQKKQAAEQTTEAERAKTFHVNLLLFQIRIINSHSTS